MSFYILFCNLIYYKKLTKYYEHADPGVGVGVGCGGGGCDKVSTLTQTYVMICNH